MALIVFEIIGESVESIFQSIAMTVAHGSFRLELLSAKESSSLDYKGFDLSLESALAGLKDRRFVSLLIYPKNGGTVRYAMLNEPNFCGEAFPFWKGIIELEGIDFEMLFNQFLNIEGLIVISVTLDESIDLKEEQLNIRSFPWEQQNLIIAAVNEGGAGIQKWVIQKGRSYQLLNDAAELPKSHLV